MREKFLNFIRSATQEYYDIYSNKEETFCKRSFVLPANTIHLIEDWCYGIKNFKMGKSIFIRSCISLYLDYLKGGYQLDPDASLEREQIAISLSPSAMQDLSEIRRITGTRANVTIIKQAIDFSLRLCPNIDESSVSACNDKKYIDATLGQTMNMIEQ